MKRLLIYILLFLVAIIGVTLARFNGESVIFDFYFSSVELPLIVLLYLALALGALCGLALSLVMVFRARREAAHLRKRLAVCEQEIKNLREIPIKGHF